MERTPDDVQNDQNDENEEESEVTEGNGNAEEAEGVVHPEDTQQQG